MRTINSLKNAIFNFGNSLILNLLKFISRIFFVKYLSSVYLGVNGLLSNVLGLLALTELGVGTAIGYSLYKPLAESDEEKCKSLMNFYRKAYIVIAIIVLILGVILLPFLPWFIKDASDIDNLSIIYLIFLGNMVIGYLFSYKRTLITADQKNYKITPFLVLFNFITTILQIISLFIFHDYIVYLSIQVFCTLLENITVNIYINKKYPYLKDIKNAKKLDKIELKEIKTNILALMAHKVGSYVLSATDNLVISKFIGIVTVGVYSNYVLIHSAISNFIYAFINNSIASLGNLIASGNKNKETSVFYEMNFIVYCLYGISALCLLFVFNPFIELVFGTKYLLSFEVVLLIVLNYYLVGLNQVPIIFQSAAGVYKYDKFVPLIEAFVNLVISIILVHYIGLAGVLIGTFISYLLPLITKPLIVFKYVLEKNVIDYFKDLFKQIILLVVSSVIIATIINIINVKYLILKIIINLLLSLIVPTILIIIFYRKTKPFKQAKNRMFMILKKIKLKRARMV